MHSIAKLDRHQDDPEQDKLIITCSKVPKSQQTNLERAMINFFKMWRISWRWVSEDTLSASVLSIAKNFINRLVANPRWSRLPATAAMMYAQTTTPYENEKWPPHRGINSSCWTHI